MAEDNKDSITFKSTFNGLTRFAAGFTLGIVTLAGSTTRAIIGSAVNSAKFVVGAAATGALLIAHGLNFSATFPFTDPKEASNVKFTKGILEKCSSYTSERFTAIGSSFGKVFSGKKDDEYKSKLAEIFQKDDDLANRTSFPGMINPTEKQPLSPNNQQTRSIESIIEQSPNTQKILMNAVRLMMGMNQEQRKQAKQNNKTQEEKTR
ncbi:MAG: hypothetical protein WBJ81_00385 [Rickettsiales bacterium]